MYQLSFYVPVSHMEELKNALFKKGAGRLGDYEMCSWEVLGQGQYKPLKGSNPYIGESNKLEIVSEYKVEMVCEADCLKAVLEELIQKHPYETPAYSAHKIYTLDDMNKASH